MNTVMKLASPRRGSVMIAALIGVVLLAGLTGAILSLGTSSTKSVDSAQRELRSYYMAQAGVSESVVALILNLNGMLPPPTGVGSQAAPQYVQGGAYWTQIIDNGDETFSILSNGTANSGKTSLEVVVRKTGGGPFANAVYAGNSSNDPTYNMEFGGNGSQGDEIYGNVFSGNDVELTGSATVSGAISATGTITGAAGRTGVTQPAPNLVAMNYPVNNDFDVANLFVGATPQVGPDGSTALQVPESNPAHIFRVNPDDRTSEWGSTPKDDFFLEDPYETTQTAAGPNAAMATHITLSGAPGKPGPPGANHVYYVDGNLWLHNKHELDFKFFNGGQQVSVTFVVNGNIYFSDSIYYDDPSQDGVAFIAIKDPGEPDSGNIYYGDPVFGTLAHMEAFMYAEDTFFDNNLDQSGSTIVTLLGTMSAGNHVQINRNYGTRHTKLVVQFDPRIMNGTLTMPGLPPLSLGGPAFVTLSWREIAAP